MASKPVPRPKPIHPKPGPSTGSPKPGPKTKQQAALADLDAISGALAIGTADYARRVKALADEAFGRHKSKADGSVEHGNPSAVDTAPPPLPRGTARLLSSRALVVRDTS